MKQKIKNSTKTLFCLFYNQKIRSV